VYMLIYGHVPVHARYRQQKTAEQILEMQLLPLILDKAVMKLK